MKEKKKEKQSKKKVIVIVAIVLGLIAIIGFSYAYINIRKEQSGENELTTGCFTIDFEEGNAISLRKAMPLTNEEGMALEPYDFTIRNSCGLPVTYQVNIEVIETSTIESENIKLAVDEKSPKKINEYEMIIPTLEEASEGYKLEEGLLLLGDEKSYSIREWIEEEAPIDIAGKTFKSKITIIFTQYKEDLHTDFAYTGEVQEYTVPFSGYYEVELWGASGADQARRGGAGGYTKGTIYLEKDLIVYFYVGQFGNNATGQTGGLEAFNGGGRGGNGSPGNPGGGSAGGATDIRLIKASESDNTLWNESASLRSRIMVAGGGGGGTSAGGSSYNASPGGNLIAANAVSYAGVYTHPGGSQISGYAFGYGGFFDAIGDGGSNGGQGAGGGGGGYYGGTTKTAQGNNTATSGAGGSSYISGYAGVNSVAEVGGTAVQPLHTNTTIHYSGKYFINGEMQVGVNAGNGKAKISYFGNKAPAKTNTKLDNVKYIKSCANGNTGDNYLQFVEIDAIKNGVNVALNKPVEGTVAEHSSYRYANIVDGDITAGIYGMPGSSGLQCVTVDLGKTYDLDEVTVWMYYSNDNRIYKSYVLSVGSTSKTGTTSLDTILHNYPSSSAPAETSEGKRYTAWD